MNVVQLVTNEWQKTETKWPPLAKKERMRLGGWFISKRQLLLHPHSTPTYIYTNEKANWRQLQYHGNITMEYQGNFNCFVNPRICYVPNKLIRVKFPPWKDNKSDVLSVSPSSENHFTQMKGHLLKYQLHHLCKEEVWLLSTCLISNFSISLPCQCCTTASLRSNLSLNCRVNT